MCMDELSRSIYVLSKITHNPKVLLLPLRHVSVSGCSFLPSQLFINGPYWMYQCMCLHSLCDHGMCSLLPPQLYINGPYWINSEDLTLRENPGSWNRLYGMLFFEQPIGTGFSKTGAQSFRQSKFLRGYRMHVKDIGFPMLGYRIHVSALCRVVGYITFVSYRVPNNTS